MKEAFLYLALNKIFMCIAFANLQRLTTAENWCKAMLLRDVNFLCEQFTIFTEVLATLTVSEYHMLDSYGSQHGCRHFARVSAGFMFTAILSSNRNACTRTDKFHQRS